MKITKTLQVSKRAAWRKWLKANSRTEKEIWLVYFRKESGKPRIEYNDAVEEALCFGWIDSNLKKVDDESVAQRFSPRNPNSPYSQANKERLRWLAAQKKLTAEVRASLGDLLEERFEIPKDILKAIRANTTAWFNFQRFSDSYKRIRIAFIAGARNRPQEFQKRLRYFIKKTEKNKQFGFGGIEKYY